MKSTFSLTLLSLASSFALPLSLAMAQVPPAQTPQTPRAPVAQKLNLDQIQQKYLGDASNEIQVVQNRKYTKTHKFELGLMGGWVSADNFLNISGLGGYAAFHFNEAWGVRGLYWKDNASKNSGYSQLTASSGLIVNTNAPTSMLGAQVKFTPMYGKVSLLGSSIIYYDLSLYAGGGSRKTESGTAFSPLLGIGQQFFFNKIFAVGVDYELMRYQETILDRQPASATYGKSTGTRTDLTHAIFLSLSVFLGNF